MDRFQDTYYIPQEQKYISGDEVGELNAMMDTTFIADEFMRDYAKAKEQGALNLGLSFSPSEKASLAYDASFQSSSVQTAYMDIGSVLSTRKSSSFSNSLNINIGKFEGHLSSVFGKLNAVQGLTGYEYDYREVNAKVGYLFKYKKLNIHPGFDANYAHYSDEDYVDVNSNTGLLNGTAELGTVQGSVRLDYTAFGKLRLAGAWMQGYFYQPQRGYSAYQFSTSYKAGENTLLRMVASKSNSSPFVLNTYMDKTIQIPMPTGVEESTGTNTLKKIGNEALDPQEMKMIEMGLRHKFMQNLQVDVSLFYNKTKNYAELVSEQKLTAGEEVTEPTQAAEQTVIIESMQNMDLKSQQIGLTASIKYVMNKKFNTAVFATIQNTSLHDYEVSNADQYEALTGENIDQQSLAENPSYLSFDHDYTPKWYGGALINYAPTPKWNFNVSFYGYSKQKSFYTKGNQFYNIEIDPKLSGNLKASYQLNDWIKLYVNARNISHSDSQEFLFTDKTGATYLGGLHIKF
ncbi:TonB-dependent receptor [Saccharicrinis fermentans]|nr:TonB-dependent receptor [Saccharicrinis fermentans]